jgi:MFS family permease
MTSISPRRIVALMCLSQVLVQIGAFAWPALLPTFMPLWRLDNGQAGWVTGIFYAAYTLAVPFLVPLTDRVDPKKIYLFGAATTALGYFAFAYVADGFWGALFARVLAGIGWAGSYMTGLKLLADRVDARLMARAVSGHAAGIGVAGALSFVFADAIAARWGWQAAFCVSGLCAAAAFAMIGFCVPGQPKKAKPAKPAPFIDFGPVLRNRAAMAYAAAYCVHTWEMNTLRGWAVAFLAYVAASPAAGQAWLSPAAITTAMALTGTAASLLGNEAAIAWGRSRMIRITMLAAAAAGVALGFLGVMNYTLAAILIIVYGILIWLDSSALTAGTATSADPERRGATLAVHTMLGYAGGFAGPLIFGWVLDAMDRKSQTAWGLAFAVTGLAVVAGRLAFDRLSKDAARAP